LATTPTKRGAATATLTGLQRAAILVMYVEEPVAQRLLAGFSLEELEQLGLAMSEVDRVGSEVIEEVVADFVRDLYTVYLVPKTGRDYALGVLPRLLGDDKRDKVMGRLRRHISREFQDFISTKPPATIATLLLDEHPQTQSIALLLMGPDNAALVLSYFAEEEQYDLAMRMARIERIPAELADDVEASVKLSLEEQGAGLLAVEGTDATARILGRLHSDFQRPILQRIAGTDQELSDLLKRRMMLFDDLLGVDNKGVQALLKVVDRPTLLLALRDAKPEIKALFLANMSSRAADDIIDELEIMAPVARSEIKDAQERIVEAALRLGEEGFLRLPFAGEDELV
jgi:flagellar motor switch protein FliG